MGGPVNTDEPAEFAARLRALDARFEQLRERRRENTDRISAEAEAIEHRRLPDETRQQIEQARRDGSLGLEVQRLQEVLDQRGISLLEALADPALRGLVHDVARALSEQLADQPDTAARPTQVRRASADDGADDFSENSYLEDI